jgi:hypothetical protein
MMLLSPRTAKYVEARIREGDNFDYRRWLQRVREEEAQAKQVAVEFSFGGSAAAEIGNPAGTPNSREAPMHSGPALQAKPTPIPRMVYRADQKDRRDSPDDRLGQRLVMVCSAWEDFQECRKRDAVYRYLKAVLALVVQYKGRRRTKRLLRRAYKFAGLPLENADPFATVIRCTSERNVDNKTISKWARALRYAAHCKVPQRRLKTFMKKMGGVNGCADRHTKYLGRGSQ